MARSRHLLVALALLVVVPPLTAADPPASLADKGNLTLPTDKKLAARLRTARELIEAEDWTAAVKLLQGLLDQPQDIFVQMAVPGPDGKSVETLVGIRIAAERLVASLAKLPKEKPGAALEEYKTAHNANAKKLLGDAKKEKPVDLQRVADVAQRYLYTDSGPEAAELLANALYDNKEFTAAGVAFERLIRRVGLEKLEPLTLFKAARTFHLGGTKEDKENEEKVWKQLQAKAPKGLRLDGRDLTLKELEAEIKKPAPKVPGNIYDWPTFGGNPARTGQGVGGTPYLQRSWSRSLYNSTFDPEHRASNQIKQLIEGAGSGVLKRLEAKGAAVLPALFPVTATVTGKDGKPKSLIVYRSYSGTEAINLRTGKLQWVNGAKWGLDAMLRDGTRQPSIRQWIQMFNSRPAVLIENATVGTLSSDGERLYSIDDTAVPPYTPTSPYGNPWGGPAGEKFPASVVSGVTSNRLQCIQAASGRLFWEIGGAKEPGAADNLKHDFRGTYFLGAPLCLDGKLYFLNEKDRELRLVCLDVKRLPVKNTQMKDIDAAVAWAQPLGTAKEKILVDYGRRINGAQIAYAEGVLVCPTNAGVLFGIDALTHRLLWAHAYTEPPAQPAQPQFDQWGNPIAGVKGRPSPLVPGAEWKASAPVVADGKVVFALPDGPEVRCLSLRDGKLLWGRKRGGDDLYLAGVFAGRAVVVGKKSVRGLGLDDGKEQWSVETGLPSGRGVASNNVYYLPLKDGAFADNERGPGVFAIDLDKGRVVARARSKKDRDGHVEVPGNLIFADGQVISQTATEIVAYPQLAARIEEMDDLLKKNPKDPTGLFQRGEMGLEQGDFLAAVEDFRTALANTPPAGIERHLRARLFDALTELLRQDFGAGETFLKDHEALGKVEPADATEEAKREAAAEGLRRAVKLLALKARGYEGQGRAVDALAAYLELASLKDGPDHLIAVPDDPALTTRADLWAAGRLKALFAAARPPSRRLLEREVETKWAALRAGKDNDGLRGFVRLFAPAFAAGRAAQLELAERLLKSAERNDALEAEALLTRLSEQKEDAHKAAQAVEALARLAARHGQMEDAVHYYRVLKQRYGTAVIRDAKTGAQFFDDLSTDKRFLPYLQDAPPAPRGKFKGAEERDKQFPMSVQYQLYTLGPLNDPLPSLRRVRVAMNYGNNRLKLVDRTTGREVMDEPITDSNFSMHLNNLIGVANTGAEPARFGYRSVGHVVIVNLAQKVVAFDSVGHNKLWERNLLGAQGVNGQPYYNAADGTLEMLIPGDNGRIPIARVGPVEAEYVALWTRDGLLGLDPLTGRTLWRRGDVPGRCRLFGDGERLYVVTLSADGKATATHAYRGRDGAAVAVPDFSAAYNDRVRVRGGTLLVARKTPSDGLKLRLYDVASGKDAWAKDFPKGSLVLNSLEPDLAGVVGPDGRAAVIDLTVRKQVLGSMIDPKHLQHAKEVHLLADANIVYMMINVEDKAANPWGGPHSNLLANTGMRSVPVNGEVYAFDRRTSKTKWHNAAENEQFVLEQWKDMPVLLFTARNYAPANGPGERTFNGLMTISIEAYEKETGRVCFRDTGAPGGPARMMAQQYQPIYAVTYDERAGKVELVAQNYKVTLTAVEPEKKP